jgi:flagella basal body P-ring formation protein FlgA
MQMLCRLFLCVWVWMGLAAGAHASPKEDLIAQAQQWAAPALGRKPGQVAFAAMDERVKVRPCEAALVFDWPFNSKETLRARCPQAGGGGWQLFMQITDAPAVSGAAADTSVPVSRKVVVARRTLPRGTLLQADMVELTELRQAPGQAAAMDSVQAVVSAELLRDVVAGSPILAQDLRRAVLVKQGQMAVLSVGQGQGFEIAVRVEVLQDGRMGEQVRLKNPETGRVLSGVVTGPNALKGL